MTSFYLSTTKNKRVRRGADFQVQRVFKSPGKIGLKIRLRLNGFDADKPKSGAKSKIPIKRMEQIKQYVDEIDDNVPAQVGTLAQVVTSSYLGWPM